MDVPYRSSGALSAAHYSIVRKVENAANDQDVERHLIEEVAALKSKLSANASQASVKLSQFALKFDVFPDTMQRISRCATVLSEHVIRRNNL